MTVPRKGALLAGRIAAAACLAIAVCLFLPWQVFLKRQGAVRGIVTDRAGHPVINAAARLSKASLGVRTHDASPQEIGILTDPYGRYEAPCDPGVYRMSLSVPSRNDASPAQKVTVYAGRTITVNFRLRHD